MHTTSLLILRAYKPSDDAFLLSLYDDPRIQATLTSHPNRPLTSAFLKNVVHPSIEGAYFHAVICLKSDADPPRAEDNSAVKSSSTRRPPPPPRNAEAVTTEETRNQKQAVPTPIGAVFLEHFDGPKNRSAMYSIVLLPRYQGRGYGSEVTCWLIDWAFEMGGLRRVWLSVFEGNEGAVRVYEKAGFEKTWVSRKDNWRDGKWLDSIYMAILDEDYWRRKQK